MPSGIAWLGGVVATCSVALAAPALARAESLAVSIGAQPTVGKPLSVTAEGVADGAHQLYVYVQVGSTCSPNPYEEISKTNVLALSGAGESLSAGTYRQTHTYTPAATSAYEICGYLDDAATNTPDAVGSANFIPAAETRTPQAELEYWERVARQAQSPTERQHAESEVQRIRPRITAPCVVPSLKGDSLRRARGALLRAHCRLGKVSRSRGVHGALVVIRQSPAHGRKLSQGSPVAVTLGSGKHTSRGTR
jgi:hypothetical protein